MPEIRFYADSQTDGNWTVIDVKTGKPANLNGQVCCLLKKTDVDGIIDYLQKHVVSSAEEIAV